MAEVLDIILKWAIPFILSTAASAAIAYTRAIKRKNTERETEQDKRMTAVENGLQSLLRAEIIRANDKYMGQGFCPIYAKEALRRSYEAYHALGGNDIATKLYEDCMKLPENPI